MVLFWFLLALVLLVLAIVLLRLDAKQRGGGAGRARQAAAEGGRSEERSDDEAPPATPPADEADHAPAEAEESGVPRLAPFQRSAGSFGVAHSGVADSDDTDKADESGTPTASDASAASDEARSDEARPVGVSASKDGTTEVGAREVGSTQSSGSAEQSAAEADDPADDAPAEVVPADDSATAPAAAVVAATAGAATAATAAADGGAPSDDAAPAAPEASAPPAPTSSEPVPLDPTEPSVESSPRLLDKVRALLPARRQTGRTPEVAEQVPVDPLADSPIVRWLEDREFEPTPTPAPEFRHGDFALGLSALGTVSHGMFRGRRAIMGVAGGRTVLAMRRDTASDVVLDLSRPDVDAEPGSYDAGAVGALEARTSDYGRLDLIDRDRLVEALSEVPADVRRIWAEAEWVAATVDGVDDPSTWDDVVAALHTAADVLAPFPPIGGRARALPTEIDPGAPGASSGPDADPTVGMDGEVGTGTQSGQAVADQATAEQATGQTAESAEPATATEDSSTSTSTSTSSGAAAVAGVAATTGTATTGAAATPAAPEPRRTGHLRLVPDRSGARDLTGEPVVADRGDAEPSEKASTPDESAPTTGDESADGAAESAQAEATLDESMQSDSTEPEPDPFAEIMEPSDPVPARGDVAADHLAPRPPLSRPTRGTGQAYPEDASVPPLAAGASTGAAGIKPLGSEDDEDEIRGEVERFDAARIDGGSDFDERSTDRGARSRHGADDMDPSEVTQRLSVADLAARMGVDPADMRSEGRRRRAKSEDSDSDSGESGEEGDSGEEDRPEATRRERPGIDPDVEQTANLRLPPDIRD